jgi:hypothetical protein
VTDDQEKEATEMAVVPAADVPQEAMQIQGPATTRSVAIRREAVPRELEALGVKVAVDPESDMQILIIPKELRAKANVLTPVQAFQQADPNWRPSLRVVELDPRPDGEHFYKQQGKLAPRKQALELLADAAGVVQVHTQLLGRERVDVGGMMAETFTHLAILKIRKSDGTLRTLEASRTYEPFAEYEEIKSSPNTKGPADLHKKWVNEVKFAKAKNESKAINRALRAALQISHTYSAADAAKPFVVVGWNLAPQSTELVQAAIAQLYGAAPETVELGPAVVSGWDLPEPIEGEVVLEDDAADEQHAVASGQQAAVVVESVPAASAPTVAPGEDSPSEPPPTQTAVPDPVREPVGHQDGDAPEPPLTATTAAPVPPSEPVIPGVEPRVTLATDGPLSDDEQALLPKALAVKLPAGSYQGRSIGWVLELGDPADEWLAYALRQPWPHDDSFRRALSLALRAHRPEMYRAWRAEQA